MTNYQKGTQLAPEPRSADPHRQAVTPALWARAVEGGMDSVPTYSRVRMGLVTTLMKHLNENCLFRPNWGTSLSVLGRIVTKQLLGLPSDPPERNRTHCNSRIGSWSVPNQGWRITKEAQEWPLGTYTCPGLFNLHLYSLNESACASQCLKYQNVMVSLSTEQIFHVIKTLSLWIPTAGNAEERDVDLHGC